MDLYELIATGGADDLFVKMAAPRWQKMLDAGRIGAEELARMLPGHKLPGNAHAASEASALPKFLPKIREALQAPGKELNPRALENYRKGVAQRAEEGVRRAGGSLRNVPGSGPSAVLQPNTRSFLPGESPTIAVPYVSSQAGTQLRLYADKNPVKSFGGQVLLGMPGDLATRHYRKIEQPVDRSIFGGVATHEGMEAHMLNQAIKGHIPLVPIDEHNGSAAVLRERLGMRDHEALGVMNRLRGQSRRADGVILNKRLREAGAVANYTPPLGGRAHRSLDHQIARTPVTESAMLRTAVGGPRTEAGTAVAKKLVEKPSFLQRLNPGLAQQQAMASSALSVNASHDPTFSRTNPDDVRAYLAHYSVA